MVESESADSSVAAVNLFLRLCDKSGYARAPKVFLSVDISCLVIFLNSWLNQWPYKQDLYHSTSLLDLVRILNEILHIDILNINSMNNV